MAIQKIATTPYQQIRTFHKLYFKETILYSSQHESGKRNSSICSYTYNGTKYYGIIQKFCFSPPIVLIKPFKTTGSSLLKKIGNPCRQRLSTYAKTDLLSSFVVQVHNQLLPVCAIPITDLTSKCILISLSPHSYVIHIPNNFEHH